MNEIIKKLIAHITSEVNEADKEKIYDEILDENGVVNVAGMEFYPSRIISELDPIAYSCGINDYFGATDNYFEIDGEYYQCEEVESAREEFINSLNEEISELESELENHRTEQEKSFFKDTFQEDIDEIEGNLKSLRNDVTNCEKHVF